MTLPATLRRDLGMGADTRRDPKPGRKHRGVPDDSTLQKLWRKVVRAEWNYHCALYDPDGCDCEGPAQCHHIVKRSRPHLKHVPANGVLLCKRHHELVAYREWRMRLEAIVGAEKMEWLSFQEQILFPRYLTREGLTRKEYLNNQKAYLEKLVTAAALREGK